MTTTRITLLAIFATLCGCGGGPIAQPATTSVADVAPAAPEAPRVPKKDGEKMVLDVALDSPDHTTLVAAVKAAGLADALASPGGIYTVFAPTNAAFDKLPPGTVDELLKPENKARLKAIIQHHAAVPIVQLADMKDGQVMGMSDGTKVTLHRNGDDVFVDQAKILGSVAAVNGMVYVVDSVVLPPEK
jgi:uncharacterized surface protein with fasciclin (FAS1) repeats